MKKRAIAVGLLQVVVLSFFSEADVAAKGFEDMKLEEAQKAIDTSEGEQPKLDFADAALRAKRMDLIELCFKNPLTMWNIRDGVVALASSPFKEQVVLMMLTSESPFWAPDGHSFQSPLELGRMREPFVSVIKKYMPDVKLSEDLLKTRSARLKLAADIETRIKARVRLEPTGDATPPRTPVGATTPSVVTPANEASGKSTVISEQHPAPSSDQSVIGSDKIKWLWVCGGADIFGILCWMCKSPRKGK